MARLSLLLVLLLSFHATASHAQEVPWADSNIAPSEEGDAGYVAFAEPVALETPATTALRSDRDRLVSERKFYMAFNTTTTSTNTPFAGTMTVDNTSTASGGPYPVTGVSLSLSVPAGVQVNSLSGNSYFSCTTEPTQIQCSAPSFPANTIENIVVVFQASSSGTYVFNGNSSQNEFDPDLSNNSFSESVIVYGPSISGLFWEDNNNDGTQGGSDQGIAGRCLYLDGDNDGIQDPGEATTDTDANGNYQFTDLTNGTYYIRQCSSNSGTYFAEFPDQGVHEVVISGQSASGINWRTYRPATINWPKWQDMNGNGTRDGNDNGLQGWQMTLSGNTPVLALYGATNSTTVSTDAEGIAQFTNVRPGTWTFSEPQQDGWNQSYPGQWSTLNLEVASGQTLSPIGFGNWQTPGGVNILLVDDTNGNGTQDAGEGGIAARRFFWDLNSNGTEDDGETGGITDSGGALSLAAPALGSYSLCSAETSGLSLISPAAGSGAWCQSVSFESGQAEQSIFFYANAPLFISGTVWEDMNGNGTRDGDDSSVANFCMFADSNNNGNRDDGEPSFTSGQDGTYSYGPIVNGTYRVRSCSSEYFALSPDNGSYEIIISGQGFSDQDWSVIRPITVQVPKWQDMNGDGVRAESDGGIAGWQTILTGTSSIFAAYNTTASTTQTTGSDGVATFSLLRPGTVTISEESRTGWTQSSPSSGSTLSLDLRSGQDVTSVGFGNWQTPGGVNILLVDDTNGNGTQDAGEGGIASRRFFWDLNSNGTEDDGETGGTTDSGGALSLAAPALGSYSLCSAETSGLSLISPAAGSGAWCQSVSFESGQAEQPVVFYASAEMFISGTVWDDLDGDFIIDEEEQNEGVANYCIYVDVNDNGVKDDSETSVLTSSTGTYQYGPVFSGTYVMRSCELDTSPYFITLPNNGFRSVSVTNESVTGSNWALIRPITVQVPKWQDMNGNGVRDQGDNGIAGWQTVLTGTNSIFAAYNTTASTTQTTGSDGVATFSLLRPGTVTISEESRTGWTQSSPSSGSTLSLDLRSGQNVTSVGFGNWQTPGGVNLQLVDDLNGNGIRDAGEEGIAYRHFFWDINNDGAKNEGESGADTNEAGSLSLAAPAPGSYSLCSVETSGLSLISPTAGSGAWCQSVSFESGQAEQDIFFYATSQLYISGTVFEDMNGNGTQDGDENGLEGICLFGDANDDGSKDDSETSVLTGSDGSFQYGPVFAGTIVMRSCELDTSPYFITVPDNGFRSVSVTNEGVSGSNWALIRPVTVRVPKWQDMNGDGVRDQGDDGIAGWQTTLTAADPIFAAYNTTVSISQTTDLDGLAIYSQLRPGTVTLSEESRTGWTQSAPSDASTLSLDLRSGQDVTSVGFGNWQTPGQIRARLFLDGNQNDQVDESDTPIAGSVFFLDVNGNQVFDDGEISGETDSNGSVSLQPAALGSPLICTSTTTVVPAVPANDDGNGWCQPVTLVSGNPDQTIIFLGDPPNPVIIEGFKWVDFDRDGERDEGEPGLNGVTIQLHSAGGTLIATAETADIDRNNDGTINHATETGWVRFTVEVDGEYMLSEQIMDGMELTYPQGNSHTVPITGLQSPAIAYGFGNFIPALDWGDLPDPREDLAADCPRGEPINCYRTLAGVQGAAHMVSATGVRLGQRIDAEGDGQPNADATGDDDNISSQGAEDDEDGLLSISIDGTGKITLELDVSGNGYLDAWADMNDDGVMNDGVLAGSPLESFFVAQPIVNGINILETPEGTVEPYANIKFIRLRVSSTGGLRAAGVALDGEVEDYRIYVQRPQSVNSDADTGDANPGDGLCADLSGNCTLRAAIQEANASGQPFRLNFSVAGKRAVVLTPASPLPAFQVPIVIEGAGELEIDGSQAGTSAHGLTIAAGGSAVSGVTVHSFSGDGIRIESGNGSSLTGNTIHGNGGNGVTVVSGSRNQVRSSSIHGNAGLGIDLGDDGVTENDAGDADTGANGLMNHPELTLVTGENGRIEGTVYMMAGATLEVDLFSSTGCDASGNGEGETFLTALEVVSTTGGTVPFFVDVPDPIALGSVVTATATDASGNTSEFSPCFVAVTTSIEREQASELPQQFALSQNYPNPFNPVTTIGFNVAQAEHVRIEVFNMLGKRVAGLVDRVMEPGAYSVSFDAQDLPSGQYIYTMQAGSFRQTRTLVLLK